MIIQFRWRGLWRLALALLVMASGRLSLVSAATEPPIADDSRAILVVASRYLAEWARPAAFVVLTKADPAPTVIPRTDPAVLASPLKYAQYMEDVGGDLNEIPESLRKAATVVKSDRSRSLVADDLGGQLPLEGVRFVTDPAAGKRTEGRGGAHRKVPAAPRFVVKVAWPLISADRADGLVALRLTCGTDCGATWWITLRKDARSGQWRLVRRFELPLSTGATGAGAGFGTEGAAVGEAGTVTGGMAETDIANPKKG